MGPNLKFYSRPANHKHVFMTMTAGKLCSLLKVTKTSDPVAQWFELNQRTIENKLSWGNPTVRKTVKHGQKSCNARKIKGNLQEGNFTILH